jgi:hypothetical protein
MGITNLDTVYQPRIDVIKDESGVLVTDCNSSLSRWREHLSRALNVHGVTHVIQTEIQTAEQLVPEPSAFDVELAIGKAKKDAIH